MKPGQWNFLFPKKEFRIHRYWVNSIPPKYKIPENIDLNKVYDYFVDLENGNMNIVRINDTYLYNNKCDYCKVRDNDSFYICTFCNKRMCNMCNEEITTLMNSPSTYTYFTKNWYKREVFLRMCWNHKESWRFVLNKVFYCDICQKTTNEVYGKWISDRNKNIDVCELCIPNSRFSGSFKEWKNEKESLDFNVLEWLPIHTDTDGNFLLFNANEESKEYSNLMIAYCDIGNKWGLFNINCEYNVLEFLKTNSIKDLCLKNDIPTYY